MENKIINNLRVLAMDTINRPKSGHPGIALGAMPILYTLYAKHLKVYNKDNSNFLRDRFVLSAGHGSAMLYSVLHSFGFPISLDDLKSFRVLGSATPGHPELDVKKGIECSTGPLGQGVSTAVGMALANKMLASRFDKSDIKLFDNYTYALVGEGCLMEGVSFEALSFAGNLNLDNLIVLFDCNNISLDGSTKETFGVDFKKLYESIGFNFIEVQDGNSVEEIDRAITKAKQDKKPAFIKINTHIGFGSSLQDSNKCHGAPLGSEGLDVLKQNLGINTKEFELLPDVKEELDNISTRFERVFDEFNQRIEFYKTKYPQDYQDLMNFYSKDFTDSFKCLEDITIAEDKSGRDMGGLVLNAIAERYNQIVGGTADLSSSTKAVIKDGGKITPSDFSGRNIMYGVREFAMACISNGLALCGFMPFCSTFFVFSDYMKNAMRVSALMDLPVLYVLTHDSIAVGEDGPTHQPVEQLAGLRTIPNLQVFRPSNLDEVKASYIWYLQNQKPTVVVLSRQNLKNISSSVDDSLAGGYILASEENDLKVTILATGGEVSLAVDVKNELETNGVGARVVSIPNLDIFKNQNTQYKEQVIPQNTLIVSIEAGSSYGWGEFVGKDGLVFGINSFGDSAKPQAVFDKFELNTEKIVEKILNKLQ